MRDKTMTTKNTVTLNGKEYDIDTLLDEPIAQEVGIPPVVRVLQ